MEGQLKTLYVFPDTNVFVQCKQPEALGWCDLGEFDKIVLIVTRPVITEVDHQKSGSGRLAKRAKLANSMFRKFLHNDEIEIKTQGKGPAVVVVLGQDLEPSQELSNELNYSHADDQLVGIAHAYQSGNEHQVLFLSHDTGPLLMAKRVGVCYQQVPDDWLLTPENDEEQKQIRELEGRLKRLQEVEPKCTISFSESVWKFTRLKRVPLTNTQVEELIEMLRVACPVGTDFGPSEPSERLGKQYNFGPRSVDKFKPATDEDISAYKEEYVRWLASCEAFFRTIHDKLNALEEILTISASLVNAGGQPANDVMVSFQVVSGDLGLMSLPSKEDRKNSEKPLQLMPAPRAPQGRWVSENGFRIPTALGVMDANRFDSSFLQGVKERDPNCFYWKGGRPSSPVPRVEFECAQWRHQDDPEAFDLRLVNHPELESQRGAIAVVVRAANLREPVKMIQRVEIVINEVDPFNEAKALICVRNDKPE